MHHSLPYGQIICGRIVSATLPYGQIADDNYLMDIGQAIYALRKEKGLKLEEVANDAGTDSGHLSRIESGSRNPSIPMLEKIAGAIGVRVSLIVAMAEGALATDIAADSHNISAPDLSEESIQLRKNFRTLSADNQLALVEIAKVLNRVQKNK